MITEEERAKLKVGDIVYVAVDDLKTVLSGEVINNSFADFNFFIRDISDEWLFIRKIDALIATKNLMLNEINLINEDISLIDVQIKQLEQENG